MALSDPFETTYTGRYKAKTALGEGLQKAAETYATIKAKQVDPMTMLLMERFGIGTVSQRLPQTPEEAKDFVIKTQGGLPEDYLTEPVYETEPKTQRKLIAGYEAKPDPEKVKLRVVAKKNLQDYASSANDVLGALDRVEQSASKLPKFETGLAEQAYALARSAYGQASAEPVFTKYESAVNSELIPLARKLQEEKGPITEWDVSRVEKGLGRKTLPFGQKIEILNESRAKVYSALRTKMDAAGITENEFKIKNKSLYEKSRGLGRYLKIGTNDLGQRVGQLPNGLEELLYGN